MDGILGNILCILPSFQTRELKNTHTTVANFKVSGMPKAAKIPKSPKRPRPSESTSLEGDGPGRKVVDEASGGEGDWARASSPRLASDQRMFQGDMKPKVPSAMTSETSDVKHIVGVSGTFKRVVRSKKQLTAEQVAAIATARRREMSPLLQDDAIQIEVVFASHVSCAIVRVFCLIISRLFQEQELREEMDIGLRDRCVDKSPSPSQVSSLFTYINFRLFSSLVLLCLHAACILCSHRS